MMRKTNRLLTRPSSKVVGHGKLDTSQSPPHPVDSTAKDALFSGRTVLRVIPLDLVNGLASLNHALNGHQGTDFLI